MNYLAHAYLSFGDEEILVGNIISDFVKGKRKFDYAPAIQKGITLHRLIDEFTDKHEATQQAKQFLKPAVGLYAGAFIDVVYDHFLANDTNEFINEEALKKFAASTYHQLENCTNIFPEKFKLLFPYMQSQDWLFNYRTLWGTEKSFSGVARRAIYLDNAIAVFHAFETNYAALNECYHNFFPDVKKFCLLHL
jgi:acyl carrier protein phosphodiesterase